MNHRILHNYSIFGETQTSQSSKLAKSQRTWSAGYPLVICYSSLLKIAIEIVDLPINSMVDLSSSLF